IPDGQDICPLEPGLGCLEIGPIYDADVFLNQFSRFPIPNCIRCGGEYVRPGLEVTVNLNLPVGFEARIVDSNGQTVAKGKALGGGGLTLNFKPATFAGPHAAAAGLRQTLPAAIPTGVPGPDEVRYSLELAPAEGVDANTPYRLA